MNIEVGDNFKFIYKEVFRRCEIKHQSYRYEFTQMLRSLEPLERFILAKHFCKHNWNIGSLHVLGVLQELRILTATEFILSQTDAEQIQLMLNDFLETEHQLLANLFITNHYDSANSVKLSAVLEECLTRLYTDLLHNSNLNNLDYLKALQNIMPPDLQNMFMQKHINILLDLHSSSVKEAYRNFSNWINEGVDDIKFTKHIYKKLFCHNEQEALTYLFKLSTMEHFKEWKFYLIMLQTIASRCTLESAAFTRKYLKTRMRQVATFPTLTAMLHLLLTSRAAHATTLDVHRNVDAYACWYKQNIGDMKFILTTEEFQTTLKLLEETIAYEMEADYLEVHTAISISPPVLCGKLVQAYKSQCKIRLSQLKSGTKRMQANESIIIDDSD